MQLKITVNLDEPLELPINYHHILQAIIYKNIDDGKGLSQVYHEQGANYEKRTYKLFTFSLLKGKYRIKGKKICFIDRVQFEVRSLDDYFIFQLQKNLITNGITFGNTCYKNVGVQLSNICIETDEIQIEMDSPICVYSTEENGFTNYHNPWSEEFAIAVNNNFVRKFDAAYGELPLSVIHIEPVKVSKRDKYVTRYKDTYICGWKGIYRLQGEPVYLNFLYQTGLGSKNAQGFGLFQVL